ncbi:hypothetical protein GAP32_110 [Cronobacter phage vB_CsaM_GAP32]|uniref:Uncharacterized protein n=1 Tax=Cronobacter phage vB_CsaM_GAP32 TaxID=1141136 RepID=K4F6J3_9CAUD|nr:hypothetical protein GAP32_110 [Cronobacter phage vB_CsaM_GAP32]AFC21558.1 hypothetical protein GAP32_110 [Cronobacter phage vB_CsaM_GAP32]
MKFLVILIFLTFAVAFTSVVLYSLFGRGNSAPRKNIRNYKVRFDAAKEKYYIVNQLDTHDEPVTNSLGFRVMYKDKPKAEFVAEKYNA